VQDNSALSLLDMRPTFDPPASPSAEQADAIDAARRASSSAVPSRRNRLRTESLFAGANEIEIQHGEAIYRLRITSLGKLILTK
jgi:hemin uptake protein HemP